jgi:transcriptional regulator with XRE-family HTH domain
MEMDDRPVLRWGRMVETLRNLRGWSQENLAAASGVANTSIARQEKGGVSQPLAESREKIEKALGIDGWSNEVAIYLGELSSRLAGEPERREVAERIKGMEAETARRMKGALWMGLLELRGGVDEQEEPGLAWGALISTLRTLLGWSQEELARKAGVNVSTVSRQELETADPSAIVREKVVRALGLDRRRAEEVRIEIGGLRAMMLTPKRERLREIIEQRGDETGALIGKMLRVALAEGRAEARGADPRSEVVAGSPTPLVGEAGGAMASESGASGPPKPADTPLRGGRKHRK